jgi:integrase/recombinase XerD
MLGWLAVEKGRSHNTLAAYRRDLAAYEAWLAARSPAGAAALTASSGVPAGAGPPPVEPEPGAGPPPVQPLPLSPAAHAGVGEATIAEYVAHLRESGLAPASVARALVAVRSLYRFLADEGAATADPACEVRPPPVPQSLPKALSEQEVASLIAAVKGEGPLALRDRAVLEVLYGTGMRISELTCLDMGDVWVEDQLARVMGKGGKERLVPLGRHARLALVDWLGPAGRPALVPRRWARRGDTGALFLNARGGRLTRQGAWGIVRRYGQLTGLSRRLTPHVLRHSCATHMLDHGADIRVVQELLGHASISTTQIYTKVSPERLRSAYLAAHPRARDS